MNGLATMDPMQLFVGLIVGLTALVVAVNAALSIAHDHAWKRLRCRSRDPLPSSVVVELRDVHRLNRLRAAAVFAGNRGEASRIGDELSAMHVRALRSQ